MTDIYVGTDAQFNAAIKNAQPGSTIYLAPGTYAPITIKFTDHLGITITSLDPDDPAVMTGLNMRDSSGIAFSNLKMEAPLGTHNAFSVFGAKDVSFDSIEMYGPDNLGSGEEVAPFIIRQSEHVSVTNSEFHHVWHAVQLLDVEHVLVDGNSFHNIRTDAVRGGGVSNSQISNNHFTDFYPAEGDHADAIQLWSTQQTTSAENILITGNVIVRGDGEPIQGIFIRDTFSDLPFKNVTVTDNVVLGGAYNAIMVDGVIGGTVTDNLVAGYEDQRSWIRVIRDHDTNVSDNTSTFYIFDTKDSPHYGANLTIPEKGLDYASSVPGGISSEFLGLTPAEVMEKVAQLTGQDSSPAPEPPVVETPEPEEPVGTAPEDEVPVDSPPAEEAPEPVTPPSNEPPTNGPTDPEENDDSGAPSQPPAGEKPDSGENAGRAIHVGSDAELKAALSNAQPGDTIYLAAGNYAPVTIRSVDLDITITSADPENPAVMTGLTMRDASGVTFSNLTMAAPLGTHNAFTVFGSSDVAFNSITMHGPENMGSGQEVSPFIIRESERVSVTDSEFYNVNHAVQLLDVEHVTISGNTFHDVKGGAVRGGGVSNSQITDNHFSDFRADGGSASAIQLWTTQQSASAENLVITGNVIVRGDGDPVQGIFIRDQDGNLPFKNVTVADNVVLGGAYNAIMVDGIISGTVTGNLVAGYQDQRSWIRVISDKDTLVSGNSSTFYVFDGTNSSHLAANQTIPENGVDYALVAASGAADGLIGLSPAELLDKVTQLAAQDSPAAPPAAAPPPPPLNEIRGGDGNDKLSGTAADDLMIGGSGNDIFYGRAGNDHIYGGDGDDTLEGQAGDDWLFGGDGNDLIIGGIGNDIMTGGAGADTFLFRDGDLGNGSFDIITDYEPGIDRPIHLRGVDANINTAQDDNFTFIGNAAFSGKAGELNYAGVDGGILVSGDLNGDGIADFGILLKGLSSISAQDFLL